MVESTARAVMLDNAQYLGQLAGKCDTNQPLQAARREELLDLQGQQIWKADRLQERIRADAAGAAARRAGDSRAAAPRPTGSARWRADVAANVPKWVASHKGHERNRARADPRPELVPDAPQDTGLEQQARVLQVVIDKHPRDDMFTALVNNPLTGTEETQFGIQREARFCHLWAEIGRRVSGTITLMSENNVPLRTLRGDYLVKDIPELDDDLLEMNLSTPETWELPYLRGPRNLARKPPNEAQKARMRSNRTANKRVLKDALKHATPKSKAAPKRFPGATSKAAGAPPAT